VETAAGASPAVVAEGGAGGVGPSPVGRLVAVMHVVRRGAAFNGTPVPALPAPVRAALWASQIHAPADFGRFHAARRVRAQLYVVLK
jgi:hypothetical protein